MMLYDLCVALFTFRGLITLLVMQFCFVLLPYYNLSLLLTHILSYMWFRSNGATTIAAKASSCPSLGTSVQTCEEGWMQ